MRDKGGGGEKTPKMCVTSFMDGPLPFLPRLARKILATSDPLFCRLSCNSYLADHG